MVCPHRRSEMEDSMMATITKPEVSQEASATGQPLYRRGFDSLNDEIDLARLPVQGQLPTWLSGSLVRTGPARFEVGEQNYKHWFDGLAMLHLFSFSDGDVAYRNRFLHSKASQAPKRKERSPTPSAPPIRAVRSSSASHRSSTRTSQITATSTSAASRATSSR